MRESWPTTIKSSTAFSLVHEPQSSSSSECRGVLLGRTLRKKPNDEIGVQEVLAGIGSMRKLQEYSPPNFDRGQPLRRFAEGCGQLRGRIFIELLAEGLRKDFSFCNMSQTVH